eukprot:Gregarina_sp_Pseudo_9__3428@NODE_35_length_5456_cov_132_485693_g32_i0_p2_GENE_NODE_35_length_5456_cov_132_485693_g32_i0NODE_35_length_5456_cov_132_485693_g32_i0_p2_ORF_typecomplete_len340_score72_58Methyltransf_23/PF13489_6/1_4e24Methyltransf_31/PF13847_6/2_8e17Methyltransf_11/PF08241_12/1_1e14Methyltransf_12/PF08242_12/3_7e12MetW/PF07021_12/0_00095MetW/PF07021_12/0_0001Ubie_methyltran/PF01209_18/2_6e10NodS/PF05401_11/5_6e05NodS/PF05401_11/0_018CMAS/PF02353_20/4_4e07Methyltransf_16/PF10294_9/6_4
MSTVDPSDAETWNSRAADWHSPESSFEPLRLFTPLRLDFLKHHLWKAHISPSGPTTPGKPLSGYKILDIGCGGGYVAEALVSDGATVVAVDCNASVIDNNRQRQVEENDLERMERCLYLKSTAEELVKEKALAEDTLGRSFLGRVWNCVTSLGQSELAAAVMPRGGFDAVVASEVLEHVKAPRLFLQCLDELVKPEGLLMVTTPNRTWLSRLALISLAENVLKLVPKGVHSSQKFVRHDELAYVLNSTGCGSGGRWAECWTRPRLAIRKLLGLSPLSEHSPLHPASRDAAFVKSDYRHLGTQGVLFCPGLNTWTRVPTRSIGYMAAFKKTRSFAQPADA